MLNTTQSGAPPGAALAATPQATLLALMDLEEYRKQRAAHLLRTPEALKWFVRQHGAELIEAGAMFKIANRWTAHADRFDQAILRIGQRMATAAS